MALVLVLWAGGLAAETVRFATFNVSLNRRGAGFLLQELERRPSEQAQRVAAIIQTVRPDVLLINELDHDPEGRALSAFLALLAEGQMGAEGISYAYTFAPEPNTGVLTGRDLDGDGSVAGARDAQGFGYFPGQYGMALLSRYPIDAAGSRTFSRTLWADVPWADPPGEFRGFVPEVQRLSSKGHWDVAVTVGGTAFRVLASHPTPPVFDGPEDMNGRRNHEEIRFWTEYLGGAVLPDDAGQTSAMGDGFPIVMGDLNADPFDGDARREAVLALLDALSDPMPGSSGALAAAASQGGANKEHSGPHALDTADWNDERGPGNLRVDYVLPDARLKVADAGVFWPAPGEPGFELLGEGDEKASDHRLVWVDVVLP